MISRFFAVLIALWPSLGSADALPAFYDVAGVASDDVLNVRAAPGVGNSIVDTLTADARNVEVVALNADGDWGQINVGEMTGWISMTFLTRQPGQPDNELPRPLACFGTEPFWSLDIGTGQSAELGRPDADSVQITMLDPVTSSNRTDRYAIFGQGGERVYTFIFHRDACGDGMSDRAYGISVDLFLTEETGVNYVTGCCSLTQ